MEERGGGGVDPFDFDVHASVSEMKWSEVNADDEKKFCPVFFLLRFRPFSCGCISPTLSPTLSIAPLRALGTLAT